MSFLVTLIYVATMIAYCIPGFFLIKFKALKADNIAAFSKLLLFILQPCQFISSFLKIEYEPRIIRNMVIFFLLSLIVICITLGYTYLLFKRKNEDIKYRVMTIAAVMSNCTFMGIPLLETLLPQYKEGQIYAITFSMCMNIIAWTICAFLLTRERSYFSIKRIIINPAVLPLFVALPLFISGILLPDRLKDMISLLGQMTTPLCMIILGMRLATVSIKETFLNPAQYIIVIINQILMPLSAYVLCLAFGINIDVRNTLVIISSCPIAALVLNLTEILKGGQKTAGGLVLVGTISSVFTIPIVTSLLIK